MGDFQRIYTDEQRDAFATAFADRGIKPARRVSELAARGELEWEGKRLAPFKVPPATVRDAARDLRKRRLGHVDSQLSHLEPRDAFEILRRRLLNSADAMLAAEERRKPEDRNADRQRDIARMAREAAAIKPPTDEPSRKPGQRENGKQPEGPSRNGMAGQLLAAHRNAEGSTAQNAETTQTHTENGGAAGNAPRAAEQHADAAQERAPGSLARAAATRALEPA